jgi:hypothetical protein
MRARDELWCFGAGVLRRGDVQRGPRLQQRDVRCRDGRVRQPRSALLRGQRLRGSAAVSVRPVYCVSSGGHDLRDQRGLLRRFCVSKSADEPRVLSRPWRILHELCAVLRVHALRQRDHALRVSSRGPLVRRLHRVLQRNDLRRRNLPSPRSLPHGGRPDGLRRGERLLRGAALRTISHDESVLSGRWQRLFEQRAMLRKHTVRGDEHPRVHLSRQRDVVLEHQRLLRRVDLSDRDLSPAQRLQVQRRRDVHEQRGVLRCARMQHHGEHRASAVLHQRWRRLSKQQRVLRDHALQRGALSLSSGRRFLSQRGRLLHWTVRHEHEAVFDVNDERCVR